MSTYRITFAFSIPCQLCIVAWDALMLHGIWLLLIVIPVFFIGLTVYMYRQMIRRHREHLEYMAHLNNVQARTTWERTPAAGPFKD